MRLKLFRARDMAGAMRAVREELGADAIILSSRRVSGGVEVSAALDEPAPPKRDLSSIEEALSFHRVPDELSESLRHGILEDRLRDVLKFAPVDLSGGSRPVLFAGPPGAGKTLTVARLATRFVMSGKRPMVITADGHRAGAVEQLAAFTRLLGLDLVVANHPAALVKALAKRSGDGPILVDLPGGCCFDRPHKEEIEAIVQSVSGRMALVLPAGLDPMEAAEMSHVYFAAGAEYLIATRTDISRRIGCIISAASVGLFLSEAGVGPGAADGLVPMTPIWLARRLLLNFERHQFKIETKR